MGLRREKGEGLIVKIIVKNFFSLRRGHVPWSLNLNELPKTPLKISLIEITLSFKLART